MCGFAAAGEIWHNKVCEYCVYSMFGEIAEKIGFIHTAPLILLRLECRVYG